MGNIAGWLRKILESDRFYLGVIVFFIAEGLWITFSAAYPMAFDEGFHLGVIRLYAESGLPWLPPDAGNNGVYGAVTQDPSFFFHWLMSFPYRLISLFTQSEATVVVFLRLLNLGMFTAGLLLFGRLLAKIHISAMLHNTAVALFVLIPVVPLLGGQINYDNLLMVFVPWTLLLVVDIYRVLQKRVIDVRLICLLLLSCIFGSLVKYAFLPIAVTALVIVGILVWLTFRGRKQGRLTSELQRGYGSLSAVFKVGFLVLFLIGAGLSVQRYGVNILRYGGPVPECDKVLSVGQCANYGPWGRNYHYAQSKGDNINHNPITYTVTEWLPGMHMRLFFMINGPHHHVYENYPPPEVIGTAATALAFTGFGAVLVFGRRVFRANPPLLLITIISAVYVAAVWYATYEDFLYTGVAVAINGRYLLPVLLSFVAVAGVALGYGLRRVPAVKAYAAAAAILLFLQGGGVFSYILRSDPTWHWPNRIMIDINTATQKALSKVMLVGPRRH